MIGRGLEADQNEVADPDGGGVPGAFGVHPEIAFRALHLPSLAAHHLIVGAEQEVGLLAGPAEFGSVVAAQCAGAHDGDFHGEWVWKVKRALWRWTKVPLKKADGITWRPGWRPWPL